MTAATHSVAGQYLTFALAQELFAVDIHAVREIIEYGHLTSVPMMPPSILGVINLRGAVVPVIDLGLRFGGSATSIGPRTCIVILEIAAGDGLRVIGMVVDAVSEVVDILASNPVNQDVVAFTGFDFLGGGFRNSSPTAHTSASTRSGDRERGSPPAAPNAPGLSPQSMLAVGAALAAGVTSAPHQSRSSPITSRTPWSSSTRSAVKRAAARTAGRLHVTPLLSSIGAAEALRRSGGPLLGDGRIRLKSEHLQRTGSYKVRGMLNRVTHMVEHFGEAEVQRRGLITFSAGNAAAAYAWAGREFKVPVHVVMPRSAVPAKIAACESYGATVHLVDGLMGEAALTATSMPNNVA